MSTDYSKMSDFEINYMIAKILHTNFDRGVHSFLNDGSVSLYGDDRCFYFNPCNNPADAWPIINDNKISIYAMSEKDGRGHWGAEAFYPNESYHFNDNPLHAAMIVFLMMQGEKNG